MLNEKQTRARIGQLLDNAENCHSLKIAYNITMQALGAADVLLDQELTDQITWRLQTLRVKWQRSPTFKAGNTLTDSRSKG